MSAVTVLSGPERRRRWTAQQKAQIVEESYATGAIVAEVARRHDVNANQLHLWRQQAREGRLDGAAAPEFLPVEITAPLPAASPSAPVSLPARRTRSSMIEIELGGGCRVWVDRDVDADALCRVLEVLRRR